MSRKNKTASERCTEIYAYIRDFLLEKGYPPSVREIGTAVGLSSSSTVHAYLHMLESRGKIHRDPTKPRAIELVGEKPWEHMLRVPLVGAVAAGVPITAEENVEEVFNVPSALLGTQADKPESHKDADRNADTVAVHRKLAYRKPVIPHKKPS